MKAGTRTGIGLGVVLLFSVAVKVCFAGPAASFGRNSWNPKAAAAYLDQRAQWWMSWPGATRDHETFCISCHTALPYALSRSALGTTLGDQGPSPEQLRILGNVTRRVRLWNEVEPSYNEQVGPNKALQSRGTESVLNALILANFDARNGKLSHETRAAFQDMWALQRTTGSDSGAWPWLNFENEPFEANDSVFYGACLAAVAVGTAPDNYRVVPEIQGNVKSLRDYLNREYVSQSLSNQAVLLWASAKLPGLLTRKQQAMIADGLISKQQSDGGWSLSSLAWTWRGSSPKWLAKLWIRSEASPFEGKSDGYATGMIAFALEQYGLPRDNAHLARALDWLRRNQIQTEGRWPGYSLNHAHEQSPTGLFMSDAATAYAVLALIGSSARP
jgi:squalene-hopene/tetraprenyl-beta-curcumene cyclase